MCEAAAIHAAVRASEAASVVSSRVCLIDRPGSKKALGASPSGAVLARYAKRESRGDGERARRLANVGRAARHILGALALQTVARRERGSRVARTAGPRLRAADCAERRGRGLDVGTVTTGATSEDGPQTRECEAPRPAQRRRPRRAARRAGPFRRARGLPLPAAAFSRSAACAAASRAMGSRKGEQET